MKNIVGERYGRLTVVRFAKMDRKNGTSLWECLCDCGKTTIVRSFNLTSGHTLSCGCVRSERSRMAHTKHGKCGTRLHTIWKSMLQRCTDKNNQAYPYYGGRGIKVSAEWNDYTSFEKWALNNGYSDNLTLDRVDNNSDYSPQNCRWADRKTQMRNVRTNRLLTYNGVTKVMSEWAELYGLSVSTLHARLKLGWSVEDAITRPLRGLVNR